MALNHSSGFRHTRSQFRRDLLRPKAQAQAVSGLREAKRQHKRSIHTEVLGKFARSCIVDPTLTEYNAISEHEPSFRFPALEFKSVCLSVVSKLNGAMIDKGFFNKSKSQLCSLLLSSSQSASTYEEELMSIVEASFERDQHHHLRLLSLATDQEARDGLVSRFSTRKKNMARQIHDWVQSTIQHPYWQLIEPFLEQVLSFEPEPLFENRRDGQLTERLLYTLVEQQLPPGWLIYQNCKVLRIDDEPFPNHKGLKGEADLLIVDPQGIVQCVLEVKTASGNLFLALYEDVNRLQALVSRTAGKRVTFSQPDAEITLDFSPSLRPIYTLGCELHPDDLAAVVRSAQTKLLAMEVGRLLSSKIEAWASVQIDDINPAACSLRISKEALPQCTSAVTSYFSMLSTIEIYTLQKAAWSQRRALEEDRDRIAYRGDMFV